MQELNDRTKRFIREYMIDNCGKAAAVRAGYTESNAESRASILLKDPRVKAELDKLKAKQAKRLDLKSDDVVNELRKIAFANPIDLYDSEGQLIPINKLPRDFVACIRSIRKSWDRWGKVPTYEITFWDKVKALEILARHLHMLSDDTNIRFPDGIPKELSSMSQADLDKAIEHEAARIKRERK